MSYYIFHQGERVWRSVCTGSVDRDKDFTVVSMTQALRTRGTSHGKAIDGCSMTADFTKRYARLLYHLFGGKAGAYYLILKPNMACGMMGVDLLFQYPYAFTVRTTDLKGKRRAPMASRHACWQVLRQIAFRHEAVVAAVERFDEDSKGYDGDLTTLAAEVWYRHIIDGSPGENFNNALVDRDIFISSIAYVLQGIPIEGDEREEWHQWSSRIFANPETLAGSAW